MAVIVKVSTFTFSCRSFSLTDTPNFCSSSMISKPRSFETYILADDPVGADQDIHLARFSSSIKVAFDLCGRTGPADIIDLAREILQALTKRLVMLESQYGGGYQHGHLLIVRYRLECRTDSHLGLSETNVSTKSTGPSDGYFPYPPLTSAVAFIWSGVSS